MSSSEPKRGVSLAKLAAFFAATFIISLGICGYTLRGNEEFGGDTGFLSLIGMIVSAISLIVIGITALIRKYK